MGTTLKLQGPVLLSSLFDVPPDESIWTSVGYRRLARGIHNPDRPRASFGSFSRALVERGSSSNKKCFGVYAIGFSLPVPALYVGVASASARSPEGVVSRLRKHRLKSTGSDLGVGFNHTERWRPFAQQRYRYFQERREKDILSDAIVLMGDIDRLDDPGEHKKICEYFEHQLVAQPRLFRALAEGMLGVRGCEVVSLNARTSLGRRPVEPRVDFWGERIEKLEAL